jgi:hypothetical protein
MTIMNVKAVPILFLKAHVPAHPRRLPNGRVIQVRPYDNSRRKQAQRDDRPHEQQADRIGDATYRGIIDDLIGQGLLSVSDSSKPLAKSRPVLFVRAAA